MRKVTVSSNKVKSLAKISTEILIDGQAYANIENGATEVFEIDEKSHRIQAVASMTVINTGKTSSGKGSVITIEEGAGDISFDLQLKFNLFGIPTITLTRK